MIKLPQIFRRSDETAPRPVSDVFDVFHAGTMEAVADRRGQSLGDWGPGDAEDPATAARLILGVLREQRGLRRKFPRAITSGDPAYREWLLEYCVRELKFGPRRLAYVSGAFVDDPARPVRDYFLHSPELQSRYPLALLPVGQKRFVKWLVGKGRDQHDLSDEQVLWFLHATAEDLARYVALTYTINPDWQQRFPLADLDEAQLIRWLRREFPKYAGLRLVRELPQLAELRSSAGRVAAKDRLVGVNVLSHFCYPSGIQQAAVEAKRALEAVGLQTSCRDVPSGVRTPHLPREEWLGFEHFPITITNVAPEPLFVTRYHRAGLAPRSELLHVAYWAWELDAIPDGWVEFGEELDEIWAPTPFVAEAMRTKMRTPVFEMLPAVAMGEIDAVDRRQVGAEAGEFVFLFMFDMASDFERKNPLAAVRAFRQAFGPNDAARLVLKASRSDFDPENFDRLRAAAAGAKITIIDEFVSRARAYGYIAMCDCAVSLHRSEGFGLLMAEAMLMGKPVIATNYSGNTAFMNRENSLPVDYELVTIEQTRALYRAGYRWAEPSVDHAAKLMRQVFEKRDDAKAMGARAKAELTPLLAPDAAGQRMKARLIELFAAKR